ncbi:uncharacterized protein LOC100184664 [Ciona intestinalis]
MENSTNSLFDGFGDNFLEDLVTNEQNENRNNINNYNESGGGSLDILQQSLQAAEIINNESSADFDGLDDFSFNLSSNYGKEDSLNDLYGTSLPSNQSKLNSSEQFDASQFLNLPQQDTSKINQTLNGTSAPSKAVYISEPSTPLTVTWSNSPTALGNSVNTVTIPTTNVPNATAQGYNESSNVGNNSFKIQLSSNVGNSQQSGVYVITSHQLQQNSSVYTTISQSTASAQSRTYLVSNGGSNFYSAPAQTFTSNSQIAPNVVQTSNIQPSNRTAYSMQQYPTSNSVNMIQLTPLQNSTPSSLPAAGSVVQTVQTGAPIPASSVLPPVDQQQTNKLAILLQKRASQTTGGAAVLRVGNQNINISNPEVATALAANILRQQRLKQQQQQPQSSNSQILQQQHSTANSERTFINIAGVQQNSVHPAIKIEQPKAQYVISPLTQRPQSGSEGHVNNTIVQSSRLQTTSQPGNKSNSPVPINRIQIASVNIPISTPQNIQINVTALPKSSFSTDTTKTVSIAQAIPIAVTTATTVSSALVKQLASNLKLKLTTQQASQLTKEQLQRLLIQHQAAVRARKVGTQVNSTLKEINSTTRIQSNSPSNVITVSANTDNTQNKPVQFSTTTTPATPGFLTFRVDPKLTYKQVEQVQHIISHKLPLAKAPPLTREQKQLLAAFRAQLKSMDTPVQQYYLRNPQLFLQKVYQHLQTGKEFVLHVKADTSLKSAISIAQSKHPTISLTNDPSKPKLSTIKINRTLSPIPQLAVKRGIKRPADDDTILLTQAPKTSLIIQKLEEHQDLCTSADTDTMFNSIDDAIERLLPYHVCNMPEIMPEEFDKSEPLFSSHSTYLVNKMDKMLAKYNMLSLREDARSSCSANLVMLERSFLQHERAEFAKLKQAVLDDPSQLLSYIPRTPDNREVLSLLRGDQDTTAESSENSQLYSDSEASRSQRNSYEYGDTSDYMESYCTKPHDMYEAVECEVVTFDDQQDTLLQEAVDSILS